MTAIQKLILIFFTLKFQNTNFLKTITNYLNDVTAGPSSRITQFEDNITLMGARDPADCEEL